MMKRRILILASVAAYATLLLAFRGCHAPATLTYLGAIGSAEELRSPEASGVAFTARASGLLVGPLSEDGAVGAGALWSEGARDDVFRRRMSNSRKEETVLRTITRAGEDRVDIELRVDREGEAEDETVARNELVMEEDGEIAIVENAGSGIASTFDPPVLLLPPVLMAGEEITRTFAIESKGIPGIAGEGQGESVLRGIGRQPLRTPAGDFNAFVLESLWAFSIGAAKIEFSARSWIDTTDNGAGLVAEEQREIVKVFGLKVHDVTRVSVIEDVGADG